MALNIILKCFCRQGSAPDPAEGAYCSDTT